MTRVVSVFVSTKSFSTYVLLMGGARAESSKNVQIHISCWKFNHLTILSTSDGYAHEVVPIVEDCQNRHPLFDDILYWF